MLRRHFKLLFLLTITYFTSWAQTDFRPGYIVRNTGDTLRGFVDYKTNRGASELCNFKENKDSEFFRYKASDIRAYGFENDRDFRSVQLPGDNEKKFAHLLVSGPATLFRYNDFFLINIKDSLVELPKPQDKIIRLKEGDTMVKKDTRYVGILNQLFGDCRILANETRFAQKGLIELVKSYNRCRGFTSKEKELPAWLKLNYNFMASYSRSGLKPVDFPYTPQYQTSNFLSGGLGIDLSSPRIFDRAFLSVELIYINSLYQGHYEGSLGYNKLRSDIVTDFSYLKIPLSFRYNFFQGNTPYVKAGFLIIYQINTITRIRDEELAPNNVVYSYIHTIDKSFYGDGSFTQYKVKTNGKGLWVSVGYEHKIISKVKLFGEFRYERYDGPYGAPFQTYSSLTNYSAILGIKY